MVGSDFDALRRSRHDSAHSAMYNASNGARCGKYGVTSGSWGSEAQGVGTHQRIGLLLEFNGSRADIDMASGGTLDASPEQNNKGN